MNEKIHASSTQQLIDLAKSRDQAEFEKLLKTSDAIQQLINSFNQGIEKMFAELGPHSLAQFVTPNAAWSMAAPGIPRRSIRASRPFSVRSSSLR